MGKIGIDGFPPGEYAVRAVRAGKDGAFLGWDPEVPAVRINRGRSGGSLLGDTRVGFDPPDARLDAAPLSPEDRAAMRAWWDRKRAERNVAPREERPFTRRDPDFGFTVTADSACMSCPDALSCPDTPIEVRNLLAIRAVRAARRKMTEEIARRMRGDSVTDSPVEFDAGTYRPVETGRANGARELRKAVLNAMYRAFYGGAIPVSMDATVMGADPMIPSAEVRDPAIAPTPENPHARVVVAPVIYCAPLPTITGENADPLFDGDKMPMDHVYDFQADGYGITAVVHGPVGPSPMEGHPEAASVRVGADGFAFFYVAFAFRSPNEPRGTAAGMVAALSRMHAMQRGAVPAVVDRRILTPAGLVPFTVLTRASLFAGIPVHPRGVVGGVFLSALGDLMAMERGCDLRMVPDWLRHGKKTIVAEVFATVRADIDREVRAAKWAAGDTTPVVSPTSNADQIASAFPPGTPGPVFPPDPVGPVVPAVPGQRTYLETLAAEDATRTEAARQARERADRLAHELGALLAKAGVPGVGPESYINVPDVGAPGVLALALVLVGKNDPVNVCVWRDPQGRGYVARKAENAVGVGRYVLDPELIAPVIDALSMPVPAPHVVDADRYPEIT